MWELGTLFLSAPGDSGTAGVTHRGSSCSSAASLSPPISGTSAILMHGPWPWAGGHFQSLPHPLLPVGRAGKDCPCSFLPFLSSPPDIFMGPLVLLLIFVPANQRLRVLWCPRNFFFFFYKRSLSVGNVTVQPVIGVTTVQPRGGCYELYSQV